MSARSVACRAPRGYTVVEVIMAIAVLTLGALGVIAMQKATLIGNTNARNLATATTLAQSWIERLRVDVQAWNEVAGAQDLGDTKWISTILTTGGWVSPDVLSAGGPPYPIGSPQADVMGADVFGADKSAPAFCTQVRLTRFASSPTTCVAKAGSTSHDPNLCTLYRMIRVEVRVYWDKSVRQVDCAKALPKDYTVAGYGFVYLVSSVLENNSPL
jgi:prepilin-type N-terminal cleavage/methylation domain-containing protein